MIGIVSRLDREDAIKCAELVSKQIGVDEARLEYNLWRVTGERGKPFTIGDPVDTLIVIGGDGTLLRVLHYYSNSVKVIGIRVGRRGYYMAFRCNDIVGMLSRGDLWERVYWCKLPRLKAISIDNGLEYSPILNEIAIVASKGKVVTLEIRIANGFRTLRIVGDGLLVATPTGSYAYSLSAGGPEVLSRDSIVLTPLNPLHGSTEAPKSMVVKLCSPLQVRYVNGYRAAWIVLDGQLVFPLTMGSRLKIMCASFVDIAYPAKCPLI